MGDSYIEDSYDAKASKSIPATIHMLSGSCDSQTSADVFNVDEFHLPNPSGKAGGACTSALLQVLYEEENRDKSWIEILMMMRENLVRSGYDQIPQLSSSRKMSVREQFDLSPERSNGTKRALLIGINYVGMEGELRGCHNDVNNMKDYLVGVCGFKSRNITILMDDGSHKKPTFRNIINSFRSLTTACKPGDSVFCHYSGHGSRRTDTSGDEDDGYDETLIPIDFETSGQITDDDLYKEFVTKMPEGVLVTCLMDCCHSGTVMDLPYVFNADGSTQDMEENTDFQMDNFLGTYFVGPATAAVAFGCCLCCFCCCSRNHDSEKENHVKSPEEIKSANRKRHFMYVIAIAIALFCSMYGNHTCSYLKLTTFTNDFTITNANNNTDIDFGDYTNFTTRSYGLWRGDTAEQSCQVYPNDAFIDSYWESSRTLSLMSDIFGSVTLIFMFLSRRLRCVTRRCMSFFCFLCAFLQGMTFLFVEGNACKSNDSIGKVFEGFLTVDGVCKFSTGSTSTFVAIVVWVLCGFFMCCSIDKPFGDKDDAIFNPNPIEYESASISSV